MQRHLIISEAKYDPKMNSVREHHVKSFSNFESAKRFFMKHINKPWYLWDRAGEGRALIVTRAYQKEWQKIKD